MCTGPTPDLLSLMTSLNGLLSKTQAPRFWSLVARWPRNVMERLVLGSDAAQGLGLLSDPGSSQAVSPHSATIYLCCAPSLLSSQAERLRVGCEQL